MSEARIPLSDHGFLYGDSIYETMRTIARRYFRLEDHLQRLRRSAAGLMLEVPWSDQELTAQLEQLLAALEGDQHYVRLIVTRGCGELSYRKNPEQRPNLVILGGTFEPVPEETLKRGLTSKVVAVRRNSNRTLSPNLKTGNLLNPRLAAMQAQEAEVDEGLMLNVDGNLAEASTSNLFLVLPGGVLATPDRESGLLEGVTRKVILELAAQQEIPLREEPLPAALLEEAEEAFLSSTTRAVAPLLTIGARTLACPGPVTLRMMDAFRSYAGCL